MAPGRLMLLSEAASPHTAKWAREFERRGWEVHVGSLGAADVPGATVHPFAGARRYGAHYLAAGLRIGGLLDRVRPDIVHAHYASSYGMLGAVSKRGPLVVSLWGSDVHEFPRRSPVHAALFGWSLRRADAITAVCADLARAAAPYGGGKPISVVPFGVDCELFAPRPDAAPPGGDLVVGCLKPLEPVYGHTYLLRGFADLVARRPDLPVRLRLAGAGYLRSPLEAEAAALGIAGRVEFLGRLPEAAVPGFYRDLDCFVLASLSEGLAVAAEEAAASGLPIVATHVGGNPEIVLDGKTGTLVPPRDPAGLSQALETLLDAPELRREYGRQARKWACDSFELRRCGDRFAEIYESLLAGG